MQGSRKLVVRRAVTAAVLVSAASLSLLGPAQAQPVKPGGDSSDGFTTTVAGSQTLLPGTDGQPQVHNAGGTSTTRPPPPCRYARWLSGPEMADYAARFVVPMYPAPPAGFAAHATDAQGAWYRPQYNGPGDQLLSPAVTDCLNSRPVAWFGSTPPEPAISPAVLSQIARDTQRLPPLVVSTNPSAATQTTVGLRTWVWPTGGDYGPVVSRAESGPNWAQVVATPSRISLAVTDPTALLGPCTTPRAWTTGAPDSATDCFVQFRRSSAAQPQQHHVITAAMRWTIRLTTSDGRDEALPPQPVTTDVALAVAEVQSIGQ